MAQYMVITYSPLSNVTREMKASTVEPLKSRHHWDLVKMAGLLRHPVSEGIDLWPFMLSMMSFEA